MNIARAALRAMRQARVAPTERAGVVAVVRKRGEGVIRPRVVVLRQLQRRNKAEAWWLTREGELLQPDELLVLAWTDLGATISRVKVPDADVDQEDDET